MNPEPTFTLAALRAATADPDASTYVTGEVTIGLEEIIGCHPEHFLDLVSERLIGSELLMDIDYVAVRVVEDGSLVLAVTGDVSAHLDDCAPGGDPADQREEGGR